MNRMRYIKGRWAGAASAWLWSGEVPQLNLRFLPW